MELQEVTNMDLTSIFRQASDSTMSWCPDSAGELLQKICGLLNESVIDWEKGDEDWGRILHQKRVVCLVCARIPLVIIVSDLKQLVENLIDSKCLLFYVNDMSEKTWSVDRRILERIFSKPISDNINYAKFSIDDLWWCTV